MICRVVVPWRFGRVPVTGHGFEDVPERGVEQVARRDELVLETVETHLDAAIAPGQSVRFPFDECDEVDRGGVGDPHR